MTTKARDAVFRAVQAAYDVHLPTPQWLEAIIGALASAGMGDWAAYTVDAAGIDNFTGDFLSIPTELISATSRMLPPPLRAAAYAPSPPVEHAHSRWRRVARQMGTTIQGVEERMGFEIPDMVGVLGCDAFGSGVFLANVGGPPIAPRTKRMLADFAAHAAAAYRLRTRLAKPAPPEAVCSPSGKVLDGSPTAVTAKSSLALAVKNLQRARLRRLDPEEAMAAWTAMVEGRWSLLDHVDTDGRRLVLAHRNELPSSIASLRAVEARVATLAALGHSDKYIAYELGLQRSTVASHLRRTLAKLRVRNRGELIATYGPLARLSSLGGASAR